VVYFKRLGIFVKVPEPGRVKTRLVPPLGPDEACRLYHAFLADLLPRLGQLRKVATTVFYEGDDPAPLRELLPPRAELVAQKGRDLGARLANAFEQLLGEPREMAVIVGSDSPDLPLPFIKRAFLKLKHRDVVLGPASDGGYYLVGLKRRVPEFFDNISWGTDTVLEQTLQQVATHELTCSLLPLWYDVDDAHSLALLRTMLLGRRLERRGRLHHTEAVLDTLPLTEKLKS
jgi:rSAM/selenodomain-associated transferase 1